jgi:histidyl-tRNA synthetase
VEIKELLDTLAEAKAEDSIESATDTLAVLESIFDREQLNDVLRGKWNSLIYQKNYDITDARVQLGESYAPMLDYLQEVRAAFAEYNILFVIDLCVIRSHEYYTSVSYEIDVKTAANMYIEIAGGGRYDRLVGNFTPADCPIQQVSCTGFAFGVERVINILKKENRIEEHTQFKSDFHFNQPSQIVYPKDASVRAYLEVYFSEKDADKPTSIWVG